MGDPFEEAAQGASGRPILREASIQQAVSFLNDPRVKGADQTKALSFLRGKGISDDELREAYRRCGIQFPNGPPLQPMPFPFPPTAAPPFAPHPMHLTPYHRPPPQRSSWMSVFLGITAAAGLYTAIREVLRRYVVPMYFPDAARIAEERRRRDELTLQSQEMQIVELRERIQELVDVSKKTNEKVESLTASVSTSVAQRERELSQNSELRDAIRDLSHSVTASAGTDISVVGSFSRDGRRDSMLTTGFSPFMTGDKSQKRGSLAYSYSENLNGLTTPHADERHATPAREPVTQVKEVTEAGPGPTRNTNVHSMKTSGDDQGSHGEEGTSIKDMEDDFMALPPAEVEDSWGQGIMKKDSPAKHPVDAEGHNGKRSDEKDTTKENGSDHVELAAGSTSIAEESVDELLCDSTNFKETVATSAARELFQNDLMNEAKMVLGKSPDRRMRPLSMPQMDVPLSDGED